MREGAAHLNIAINPVAHTIRKMMVSLMSITLEMVTSESASSQYMTLPDLHGEILNLRRLLGRYYPYHDYGDWILY